jgi:hypothetical protein
VSWKDEYRQALLIFAVRHGVVMAETGRDWDDYAAPRAEQEDVKMHVLCAERTTVHEMKESTWSEGSDTFNEGTEAHGLDLIVSCECGEVDHRRVRYEGTVGEILIGIFMEGED